MLHIFGYLKRSWKSVVLIFMLLIFQASCDLTLPQFTSNLVDIGIQQNGIAHGEPPVSKNHHRAHHTES